VPDRKLDAWLITYVNTLPCRALIGREALLRTSSSSTAPSCSGRRTNGPTLTRSTWQLGREPDPATATLAARDGVDLEATF
jgi:hypothetical protein